MASIVNVALQLSAAAREWPDSLAIISPQTGSQLTCKQLDDESDRIACGLKSIGVRRGMRTTLMVPPSAEFFVLTFALFKLGAVLVLIDPGMGVKNLGRCLGEAEPEAFIGIRKSQIARKLLGWGRRTVRLTVGVGSRLFCQYSLDDIRQAGANRSFEPFEVFADEMAAILFTSGSTGIAKGAVYTHGVFAAQVDALRRLYDIRPGEIDLATFPLFALFAPALGMTAVIPEMDPTRPATVDPAKICSAVQRHQVTNLFGSPALLNTVSRWAETQGVQLPTLRRVISAGAPVPATVIERTTRMLGPGAEVFTPYGATECLPVASIGSREILGETRRQTDRGAGVCVGLPVPEIEVAIIPITDEPIVQWTDRLRLPANEVGEIAVKGPFVTRSYFGRPKATALAKIPDADGSIWHRMGDVGYRDDRGRLWFCGRKSQRVSTANGTLFTIPVEAVFNTHPAVYRTALVGIGHGGSQVPVLCVELEPGSRGIDRNLVVAELLELGAKHEHTHGIRTILFHKSFPVDIRHNAKIFREKLAAWAARHVKA